MGWIPNKNTKFTGDVQVPTAASTDSDTSVATTEFVQTAFGSLSSARPFAKIVRSSAQTITTATWTNVTGTSTLVESEEGMWDASAPGRITCVTPGNYEVNGAVCFTYSATGSRLVRLVHKNSAGVVQAYYGVQAWEKRTSGAGATNMTTNDTITLAAGDYVQLEVWQDSGGNLDTTVGQGTYHMTLSAAWVGGTGAAWGNAGCSLRKTANQSIATGGAYTNLTWDSEEYDTGGMHSTSSNTDRITCVTPGLYLVTGTVVYPSTATAGAYGVGIFKNGTIVTSDWDDAGDSGVAFHRSNVTALVSMNAGDYVTLAAAHAFGVATDAAAGTTDACVFSAVRVGYQTNPNTPLVVSSLPGSPVDGQECYYQNAAMATAGIVWHLKYQAAMAGSYKWVYVGGPPLQAEVDTQQTRAAATYLGLATQNVVTTPLAGDYFVEIGADIGGDTALANTRLSFRVGGAAGSSADADGLRVQQPNTDFAAFSYLSRRRRKNAIAASTQILEEAKASAGTGYFANRYLSITPIRVG